MRKTPAPVLHWPKLFEGELHTDHGNGYSYNGNGYGDSYYSSEGTDLGRSNGDGEGTGSWCGNGYGNGNCWGDA